MPFSVKDLTFVPVLWPKTWRSCMEINFPGRWKTTVWGSLIPTYIKIRENKTIYSNCKRYWPQENDSYPGKKIRRQKSHTICFIRGRHSDKSPNSIYNFIIRLPKCFCSFSICVFLRNFRSYELVMQCLETAKGIIRW